MIRALKPWELLGEARMPDGTDMKLQRRDTEYVIFAGGKNLMSSRMHGSEEALATFGCARARTLEAPRVLIGGLGMGFTLRATLDLLPSSATVVVAELQPAVVAWNRGPLGPLAGHPLNDRRVRLDEHDVAVSLRGAKRRFDAVLLDVDNGPDAFTTTTNAGLYGDAGLVVHSPGAEAGRDARRVVRLGGPQVRTAAALQRIPGARRARPRAAQEGWAAAYDLPRHSCRPIAGPAWGRGRFRVHGSRVQGSVQGSGSTVRVQGSGSRVQWF